MSERYLTFSHCEHQIIYHVSAFDMIRAKKLLYCLNWVSWFVHDFATFKESHQFAVFTLHVLIVSHWALTSTFLMLRVELIYLIEVFQAVILFEQSFHLSGSWLFYWIQGTLGHFSAVLIYEQCPVHLLDRRIFTQLVVRLNFPLCLRRSSTKTDICNLCIALHLLECFVSNFSQSWLLLTVKVFFENIFAPFCDQWFLYIDDFLLRQQLLLCFHIVVKSRFC